MGRAKLNMELIGKEKSRNITFKKRKEGLIRKMHEFTTLCDVSACMIIYAPNQEKGSSEPEIWPQNVDEVSRIVDIYKNKNKDSGNKTFGLSDFFRERKRKIEDELTKLRKKNMEAKYPTWLEFLNYTTEPKLREFAAALRSKAEYVKSRIEFLRRNKEHMINSMHLINPIEMHLPINQYPPFDHHHYHHQDQVHTVNQNSLMMLLMNGEDHQQFGGASTSGGNFQFKRQVFYEEVAGPGLGPVPGPGLGRGMVEPVICHSPRQLARYYGPAAVAQPLYMVPGVAAPPPPQLQFPVRESNINNDGGQDDIVQYQMNLMNHSIARYFD